MADALRDLSGRADTDAAMAVWIPEVCYWRMLNGMLVGMADVTTIKVPRALRERIAQDAFRRGVTAASLIGELVDRYEREQRLTAVGHAYAGDADARFADETTAWDEVSADGLPE